MLSEGLPPDLHEPDPSTTRTQRFGPCGGSAYSLLSIPGERLRFCQTVQDQPPAPEDLGQIVVTVMEEWDREIWNKFTEWKNDRGWHIVIAELDLPEITLIKVILPPPPHKIRAVAYRGLTLVKQEGKMYTFSYRSADRNVTARTDEGQPQG